MTQEELAKIPRKTARELLSEIQALGGSDRRVLQIIESAMNLEWWRGYYAATAKGKSTE